MLKNATIKLISTKEQELSSLKSRTVQSGEPLKHDPQCANIDSMADIFDEVFEVLTDDSPLRSFQPDYMALVDDHEADSSARTRRRRMSAGSITVPNGRAHSAERPRRHSPDSYSCSVGDRSPSPTTRVRRNSTDLRIMCSGSFGSGPAPAGGFQRLANMDCNALLAEPASTCINSPVAPFPEKQRTEVVDSTQLKIPLVRAPAFLACDVP